MSSIDDLLNIESDDINDIKHWINKSIASGTSGKELKDLIMKLQFVSQDIEKSLDRLQDQLTQSIPSLKQVLSDISSESISLKEDFIRINRDVHTIHERNESVIGNLSRVHSIEKSMNLCVESLSEIHHWETRIKKVKKLFQDREFELISKELNLMKSRVAMLKNNMPQLYNTRSVIVEEFIFKLQQMVIPFLNETFENHDYRSYRYYSQILITINKAEEINAEYILNRLDAMKQLLQHFSHKNNYQRVHSLQIWFNEFLLNVLAFIEDEWDWSQQIFHNKEESIAITTKLITNICDEINIQLKEWISIFLEAKKSVHHDTDSTDSYAYDLAMSKTIALFEIFGTFFNAVYRSRLLNNSNYHKKDVLQLMPNITQLISNILSTVYKSSYLQLEEHLIWSIFADTPIISDHHHAYEDNNKFLIKMATPIRWIHENKLNDLSFIDIQERIEDSLAILVETLQMSHDRCLLVSKAALIKDIVVLYDALIVEYVQNVDELFTRCSYDASKMMSPFEIEDDDHDVDIKQHNAISIDTESSANNNWIVDLKQAFALKIVIQSVEQRITECIQEILRDFVNGVNDLCNDEHDADADASLLLFHRIFLSNSELKLLSKFSNVQESRALFVKSQLNEAMITNNIDKRMESILLNIMMQEIKECIQNINSLAVWREKPTKSEKMLNLPQFNVQPNEYIKKIGSHLLALVQQLETHSHENDDEGEEEEEEEKMEESVDSEKWLNLVLNETVQSLFMEMYKLNGLSLKGTKQLMTDLKYLCNVSNAIYLDEPEFIYAILTVLQCKLGNSNALKQQLTSNIDDDTNDKKVDPKLRTSFQRKVATKFAVLRGLNIRFV